MLNPKQSMEEALAIVQEFADVCPDNLIRDESPEGFENGRLLGKWIEDYQQGFYTIRGLFAALGSSELATKLHFKNPPAPIVAAVPPAVVPAPAPLTYIEQARKNKDRFNILAESGIAANTGRATRRDIEENNARIDERTAAEKAKREEFRRRQEWKRRVSSIQTMQEMQGGRISWGRTEIAREAARNELNKEFPEFANEKG